MHDDRIEKGDRETREMGERAHTVHTVVVVSRKVPGCRCKNCSNSINTVASIPGTQQLHEIE